MSVQFKQVIQNIGDLTSDEKALVAHCLISSLETKHDDNVDYSWGVLAKQRLLELQSGEIKGIYWNDMKKEITA